MRHAISVTLCVLVAGPALAEPEPVVVIEPGTYQVPPPAPQYNFVRPLPPPQALELERRGRNKKLAGALLMGLGGALFLGSAALVGWGFSESGCQRACFDSGPILGGSLGMLVGFGSLIAGIPVYVIGAKQVRSAQRMSSQFALGGVSVQY